MTAAAAPRQIRGKHVLIALCGFFGIMLLANGIFVYFALTTFNGVETPDAYRKGIAYNKELAAAEKQTDRGWTGRLEVRKELQSLTFSLQDRGGFPVSGLQVSAEIRRPATDKFDRRIAFVETAPGTYSGPLPSVEPGTWVVAVKATEETGAGERVTYRLKERLWLKPAK